MSISENEYARRYAAIRKQMESDGLTSLVVVGLSDDFNRGNIRYITGSGRGGICVFPVEGQPRLFSNSLLARSAKFPKTIEAYRLLDIVVTTKPEKELIKQLSEGDRGRRIGIVGMNCIPPAMYEILKAKFGSRMTEERDYLLPLREIKSDEEIEKLRGAARVADAVYDRLREIIRPGLSEYEIYGEVKNVIYRGGCEYSFDLLDAADSAMNMAFFPTEDVLEQNGTLFMEISPAFQGYYAQLPVTLPVQAFQPQVRDMVEAWHEADQAGRELLRAGTPVAALYDTLIKTIQKHGFISPLRPGHSVGLDILDFWSIEASSKKVLKPGMVVAIHPSCMDEIGGPGVGMGYTYLIKEDGYEQLSKIDLGMELL